MWTRKWPDLPGLNITVWQLELWDQRLRLGPDPAPAPCGADQAAQLPPGFSPLVGTLGTLGTARASFTGRLRTERGGHRDREHRPHEEPRQRPARPAPAHAPERQRHLHKSCGSKGRGGSGSQSSRSVSSPSSSSSSSESSSSSSSSSSLASSLAMGFCRVAKGSEPSTPSIEGNTWLCTGNEAWTTFNRDVSTACLGLAGTHTQNTRLWRDTLLTSSLQGPAEMTFISIYGL